jgi:hypothetical protein
VDTYREFDSQFEFVVVEEIPAGGCVAHDFLATKRSTAERRRIVSVEYGQRSWVGTFGGSENCATGICVASTCPDPRKLCVAVCGEVFLVDVFRPEDFVVFGEEPVVDFEVSTSANVLMFVGYTKIWLLDARARLLRSDRLSWDGFRDVRVAENEVRGLAWYPWKNDWEPFSCSFDQFAAV